MSRIRVLFTPKQIEELKNNPFTLFVNESQIRFTVEFKKFLLAEREKNHTPWKDIFCKAGYSSETLGIDRMYAAVKNIRKEAASPQGLHETISKKKLEKEKIMSPKKEKKIDLDNLTPEESLKLEIAAEIGVYDKVLTQGWRSLTAKESGRIGGMMTRRRREAIKTKENEENR